MKRAAGSDVLAGLQHRLSGASRIAVVGIGEELSMTDCLGIAAARTVDAQKIMGVKVFFAGTVPESITAPIRTYSPDHILLLDAADMNAQPGTMAVISPGEISAGLFSTHALPLTVVMDYLREDTGAAVTLLGIQPNPEWEGRPLASGEQAVLSRSVAGLVDVLKKAFKEPAVR
jgi:hydrogenase 3 maturation protease